MRMSNLQLTLIVAGVLLVIGVLIFNAWQERRIRRRIDAAFRPAPPAADASRVEPTLRPVDGDANAVPRNAATASSLDGAPAGGKGAMESTFEPPMDVLASVPVDAPPTTIADVRGTGVQPDPDIECIMTLQPEQPVAVGAIAAGLHARLGKPLRWFGRRDGTAAWQRLTGDTPGEFSEVAACLLLADRNGAASRAQIEGFHRVIGELAPHLPAAWSAAPLDEEAARAEELDRLCAELDMQIGLTIQKADGTTIPGTKLRGVAEAAGFRLAPSGRFECVQEETGAVLYTLQGARGEPFTIDSLRIANVQGVVLVLDVPRVADPPRAFDQLKLAAKRMAQTLGGDLVDDNQRPLTDNALAAIRAQVVSASELLARAQIEPGSPRAHKLFAA